MGSQRVRQDWATFTFTFSKKDLETSQGDTHTHTHTHTHARTNHNHSTGLVQVEAGCWQMSNQSEEESLLGVLISVLNFERLRDEEVLATREREGYSRQRMQEFLSFPLFHLKKHHWNLFLSLHSDCHCFVANPQHFLLKDINTRVS